MKPYYRSKGITIYHGDCREVLPTVRADGLITDPPYGVNLGSGKDRRGGKHGFGLKPAYASYSDTPEQWLNVIVPTIAAAIPTVRRAAIFAGPASNVWAYPPADVIGGVFSPGACGRHRWGFNTLLLILFYGTCPSLEKGTGARGGCVLRNCERSEVNGHPCPKPLAWMEWLVSRCTASDETILDPYMGSGTTLVAARKLGRKAIGIELEEKYCEIAATRLMECQSSSACSPGTKKAA